MKKPAFKIILDNFTKRYHVLEPGLLWGWNKCREEVGDFHVHRGFSSLLMADSYIERLKWQRDRRARDKAAKNDPNRYSFVQDVPHES